jgi:acetyl-CoA C-acetyltransferase
MPNVCCRAAREAEELYMSTARTVVIVDALRTPIGKRGGGLATVHPADLLGLVQKSVVERTGIDPTAIEQVVGGCVTAVGEQSFNVTRTAWIAAGLPISAAATTVDTQCGSSQQALNVAISLVASGVADVAMSCGVESMSRIPIGSNSSKQLGLGVPIPKSYFAQQEFTSQFEGAERIAEKWGIDRDDTDEFGLRSQTLASRAWAEHRFAGQYVDVTARDRDDAGNLLESTHVVQRDEGIRETTLARLAALKPVARENGVHTAGSSSQISDGASAVLVMSEERATELSLTPRARVIDTCLVGVDPVLMLTGPIDATQRLLRRAKVAIDDVDVFEINEAFASVVLAWAKDVGVDMSRVNPNGGAIAVGHPLGATGGVLLTKTLYELERIRGRYGLVSMCCGGGLGTGTLIERI